MEFDIILHGKPNAGSHKTTKGIEDSFCQNLVENFFQSMNYIKEQEVLIVDVRNWKNKWYSIYTLWLGGYITDTAERSSFLAISIVVPNQYFCLVSAVYDTLKNAYLNSIVGTYISSKGEYKVQNFNNHSAFGRLVNTINSNFVNLSENFDNNFKQDNNGTITNCCYNLLDCDSKAFVEDWRKHGRIFVSESYEAKDARLTNTDKYLRELSAVKLESETRLAKIDSFKKRIKELELQLNGNNSKTSDAMAALKAEIETLKKVNKDLENKDSRLSDKVKDYEEYLKQIAKLVGIQNTDTMNPNQLEDPKPQFKLNKVLPIINTFLLVIILLVGSLKSCGTMTEDILSATSDGNNEELQYKIKELQGVISKIDSQIMAQQSSTDSPETFESNGGGNTQDIDCNLTFFQDGTSVEANNIDKNKPLTIVVGNERNGYSFHTSNIDAIIESGKPFGLKKKKNNEPIIITYRSDDRKNINAANKLEIN